LPSRTFARVSTDLVSTLTERQLGAPELAVIDGNPGLAAAIKQQWPGIAVQRCTNHKLWNLLAKAPAHLREELARDYRRMIYAEGREGVEQAPASIRAQLEAALPGGVPQLRGGRRSAFTFTAFPAQWKALRITNAPERINGEFRRRTNTQTSLPNEEAVLLLLFGLLRSGQIRLRRLVGWQELESSTKSAKAA
jgi:putative transposase